MSKFSFQPDPTIEKPVQQWAGPVCISYWPQQGLLVFEAWGLRDGERRVVRSFTLRKLDLIRAPGAIKLLQGVLHDLEETAAWEIAHKANDKQEVQ